MISLSVFPWFGQSILGFLCVDIRFSQAPLVLVVFLQLSNAKFVFRGMDVRQVALRLSIPA